jgi:hypothetical protein
LLTQGFAARRAKPIGSALAKVEDDRLHRLIRIEPLKDQIPEGDWQAKDASVKALGLAWILAILLGLLSAPVGTAWFRALGANPLLNDFRAEELRKNFQDRRQDD